MFFSNCAQCIASIRGKLCCWFLPCSSAKTPRTMTSSPTDCCRSLPLIQISFFFNSSRRQLNRSRDWFLIVRKEVRGTHTLIHFDILFVWNADCFVSPVPERLDVCSIDKSSKEVRQRRDIWNNCEWTRCIDLRTSWRHGQWFWSGCWWITRVFRGTSCRE